MAEQAVAKAAGRGELLVVDDEPFLRDAVAASLRFLGFEVATAGNGADALRLARQDRFDLLVLDVMLPDTDGFEVVRRLRREGSRVPVIFLTARDTQADKVNGLTLGGDDYLTKPFGLEELAARIRSVLRRTRRDGTGGPVLTFADIELDQDSYQVRRGGRLIDLSPTEFRLLRYLMLNPGRVLTRAQLLRYLMLNPGRVLTRAQLLRYLMLNPGRVLTRAQLLAHVWDYDFGGSSTVVTTYVAYLRRKLAAHGPDVIHTQRGVGYCLRLPPPRAGRARVTRRAAGFGWRWQITGRIRGAKLRTRVLLGVLGVTLIALVAFDAAAIPALRSYLISQTDAQLRSVLGVYRVVNAVLPNPGPFGRAQRPPAAQPKRAVSAGPAPHFRAATHLQAPLLQPFSFTLVSGGSAKAVSPTVAVRGLTLGRNPSLIPRLPQNLAALAASGHGATVASLHGNQPLRLMATPEPGNRSSILVATTSLAGVNKTVGQIELILIIGSAAAGLLAAGGAAWIIRRGLRPVEAMAGQADKINAGDLAGRVSPADTRTEVGRLGRALNAMLARIEEFVAEREASQEATRRFFADASHELRTPLASLRANAELYQQGALASRDQADEAMRRITLEAQRMSGLVDDMLRLARLDQHPAQEREPVGLSALAAECALRARTADPHRTWHTAVTGGLEVTGGEEVLRRAIDNVLANVSAHTPGGTTATLTATGRDGCVVVEVSDDGPGVSPGQLPRIFDRFYRAGLPSQRPGSGLGLAIAAAAAAALGGTAEAALNEPHGLRITLTLPPPGDLTPDGCAGRRRP